jgi:hypothetical protein
MPKVHPPTERDAAIIANAIRFDIALFIGRGKYARASARTLSEARNDAAPSLEAEHPYGRRALIYAVDATAGQRSSPTTFQPRARRGR